MVDVALAARHGRHLRADFVRAWQVPDSSCGSVNRFVTKVGRRPNTTRVRGDTSAHRGGIASKEVNGPPVAQPPHCDRWSGACRSAVEAVWLWGKGAFLTETGWSTQSCRLAVYSRCYQSSGASHDATCSTACSWTRLTRPRGHRPEPTVSRSFVFGPFRTSSETRCSRARSASADRCHRRANHASQDHHHTNHHQRSRHPAGRADRLRPDRTSQYGQGRAVDTQGQDHAVDTQGQGHAVETQSQATQSKPKATPMAKAKPASKPKATPKPAPRRSRSGSLESRPR